MKSILKTCGRFAGDLQQHVGVVGFYRKMKQYAQLSHNIRGRT
ncbi:hypothetical protein KNP414_00192 [Paenibacillus mucilaginosus KNP414]|uniref:Uncharacterized protein n=1 Tax=Paenibacillus mucilaginosus (strain KNP414) TaxID=1036673 RepID=F8FKX5_PAEMK|nr:hypothetical protein KNP414_00192 [Paenibacillus mucilaginosus KNP414]